MSGEVQVVNGGGCFGCIGTILFFFVVWALIFGVTVSGVHYGIGCNQEQGVVLENK